jgi:hypothetical protein
MLHRAFWTQRRFTGITLIVGCLLALVGASMPLADPKGNLIWLLPTRGWLLVIFTHPLLWQWDSWLFFGGIVVTLLGLAMLTIILRSAGDHMIAPLGLIAFLSGTILWVIQLAFRLSVYPWAAQETARTTVLPDFFVPLTLWIQALFVFYTIFAFSALIAYGGALLATRVLPHWVGWLAIVYSLAGLGLFFLTDNALPVSHHLMPILVGVLLLLRRGQVPSEQEERQRHASPVTSGHTSGQNRDTAS